jgi:NMD protein affecting ribosome stability and mRNA decay
MSKKKLIFPVNWPKSEIRKKCWKTERIQQGICPKCHKYTGLYRYEGICQFCGYNPKSSGDFLARERKKFIKKWARILGEICVINWVIAEGFIEKVMDAWDGKHWQTIERKSPNADKL